MTDPKKVEIPEISSIDIEDLLRRQEDEIFDRTLGGQENIGKTIAGFGTKRGGILLVGQEDLGKGGKLIGVDYERFQGDFGNAINEVKPTPLTQQRIIDVKGARIILIRVQDAGTLRPCSYNGKFFERKGSSTRVLSPDEVRRYHLLYGSPNAEDIPTHARSVDVDESELTFYSTQLSKRRENILRSVVGPNNYLTVRGVVVLAGKPEDFLEGSFVEVQRYDNLMGTQPNPVGPPIKISKPARQLIEEVVKIVEQNLPIERAYKDARMIQSPAIPISVIREAITNAVAHRNYRSHEHIRIRIYVDGFDVSNPAVLTEQMWREILVNQTTYHPNEGLYTFLNPAQLYEGRGEGIPKIREQLERLGKVAPEFKVIGEFPSTFYVKISLSPAKAKDVKRKRLEEYLSKKKEITTTDVMKRLSVSRVTAIGLLNELVNRGMLRHQGNTRASKYVTKSEEDRTDE